MAVTPRVSWINSSDELVATFFRRELDNWGTYHSAGGLEHDPFLFAVLQGLDLHFSQFAALWGRFESLDELLAWSRSEIASINGVGPRTMERLTLELRRLGLKLREDA